MTANNRVRKLQSVRENFTEMKFKSGHEGCLWSHKVKVVGNSRETELEKEGRIFQAEKTDRKKVFAMKGSHKKNRSENLVEK